MENPSERLDDELEKCAGNDGRKLQFRVNIAPFRKWPMRLFILRSPSPDEIIHPQLQSLSMEAGLGSAFDGQRVRAVIGPLMSIVSKNVDDAIARDVVVGTKLEPAARIYFTVSPNINGRNELIVKKCTGRLHPALRCASSRCNIRVRW